MNSSIPAAAWCEIIVLAQKYQAESLRVRAKTTSHFKSFNTENCEFVSVRTLSVKITVSCVLMFLRQYGASVFSRPGNKKTPQKVSGKHRTVFCAVFFGSGVYCIYKFLKAGYFARTCIFMNDAFLDRHVNDGFGPVQVGCDCFVRVLTDRQTDLFDNILHLCSGHFVADPVVLILPGAFKCGFMIGQVVNSFT